MTDNSATLGYLVKVHIEALDAPVWLAFEEEPPADEPERPSLTGDMRQASVFPSALDAFVYIYGVEILLGGVSCEIAEFGSIKVDSHDLVGQLEIPEDAIDVFSPYWADEYGLFPEEYVTPDTLEGLEGNPDN